VTSDGELAQAFTARAAGALEEAYRRYGPVLRAAARHVLGTDDDARDIIHEALIRVWSRTESYRPERGALRAFLVVCVRNEALSRRRSATRQNALEHRIAVEPVERIDHTERIAIRSALAVLPREQREVIELAYWGEYTQTEIAAKLSVPLGTIKSRASLGLRKLARALGAQD
jgi:RNA polymerase sigma-70 factor (ECF subfamily)